jgi:hypothetical protein
MTVQVLDDLMATSGSEDFSGPDNHSDSSGEQYFYPKQYNKKFSQKFHFLPKK